MVGHVLDRLPDLLQHAPGPWMGRVETTEQVRQFGQADSRVIDDPGLKQVVETLRRAPLQHVDIDAGVE